MNLVNCEKGISLELEENNANLLVIEDPVSFREIVQELTCQIKGEEGSFVLSNNNEPVKITKNVEIIIDPFNIDFNTKKIQTKLYELIKETVGNNFPDQYADLNKSNIVFLDQSISAAPFSITYDLELDLIGLLKLYHLGIQGLESQFTESLIEYIRIQHQLLHINTLIFVNLKSFLKEDEVNEVYKFAFYCKINLVLLESQASRKLNQEIVTIIDRDRCVLSF